MTVTTDVVGFAALAGCLILIITFVLKNHLANAEAKRIIFRRIDDEREYNSETYLRRDVHTALFAHMDNDVSEIKADVKKLLSKNGIEWLYEYEEQDHRKADSLLVKKTGGLYEVSRR